jgi:hypothetical protein
MACGFAVSADIASAGAKAIASNANDKVLKRPIMRASTAYLD